MYKFIKIKDPHNEFEKSNIEFTIENDVSLSILCEEFTGFLKSCGFVFNGYIDLVDEDDE